jgi:hypothetical protein
MFRRKAGRDKLNIFDKIKFLYTIIVCYVVWLIAMRFPRVKADGQGFYHCISRFVHGLFIFRTSAGGCPEAEIFLSMIRRGAAFCGIQILDYGLMANHFHLLCKVPERRFLPESEVLERSEARYGSQYVQEVREELARYAGQPDGVEQSNRLLDRYATARKISQKRATHV